MVFHLLMFICDTVLVVLESMLATSISPTSTDYADDAVLFTDDPTKWDYMFFEILRHQQALWVYT